MPGSRSAGRSREPLTWVTESGGKTERFNVVVRDASQDVDSR
jgi:hypothetical protein